MTKMIQNPQNPQKPSNISETRVFRANQDQIRNQRRRFNQ